MSQLTIDKIIKIADMSVPLSADYETEGELYGKRLATTAPESIAIVADALRWHWEGFPDIPEVRATASITIDTVGDGGDIIYVQVNDPFLGVISLGNYTLTSSDTTTNLIATHLGLVLFGNQYGYAISVYQNVITIEAAEGTGALINGNNLLVTITSPGFLTTQNGNRLITQNGKYIITQQVYTS
jgi:hypothetical protein